jgi:hypothetical protein
MFAVVTRPEPFATPQVCAGAEGCVATVTAYEAPVLKAVGKTKDPDAETVSSSPLLFRTMRPWPESPETLPPIA